MDTSDYTDLQDITDILNADPNTLLSFSDENTTLKSYSNEQQYDPGFNRTITEFNSFQNLDSSYANSSSIEPNRLNNGVLNANVNIPSDSLAESRELDEISQYLVDNPSFIRYDEDSANPATSNLPAELNSYKNIYTHSNNHISFTNEDLPVHTSLTNSPSSPNVEHSAVIDEQLLTEIDSLINKSALAADVTDSPNTPNADQFFDTQSQPFATPIIFQSDRGVKLETPKNQLHHQHQQQQQQQQHHQLVKKSSVKRLPPNVSQSPTTKRLAKSSSKVELFTGMAQTAAVLATNSSSSKSLANLQRHESARAAARAVGNTSNQTPRNAPRKIHTKSSSSGNLNGNVRTKLVNARSNSNLSSLKAYSPTKSGDGQGYSVTQYTKSPSMPSIFNNDTQPSGPSSFLESPLRISRLKSAKVKPSSCSIYSSATSTSVRTNISNTSNGSNTSKSSRGSGTFDQYSHLPGSSDTLETIVSMNTDESSERDNNYHQFSISTKGRSFSQSNSAPYSTLQYQPPSMHTPQLHLQFQPPPPSSSSSHQQIINISQSNTRTSSTLSTKTDSSTASPSGVIYTSTPSPIPGSSNITFTPPNIVNPNISNNYSRIHRAQSITSTEMEFMNSTGSPLTPVSKTALKFEQLSTNSPQFSNGGKFQNSFGMPISNLNSNSNSNHTSSQPIKQETDGAPRLSVWKTSPSAADVRRERAGTVSLNFVAQSQSQLQSQPNQNHKASDRKAHNRTKFTNNFIEEPISYRTNRPRNHSRGHNGHTHYQNQGQIQGHDSNYQHGHGTHTFSVVPSSNDVATSNKPTLSVSTSSMRMATPPHNSASATPSYPSRMKSLTTLNHVSRNSMHSVHSSSSTNSTISNPSTQDDKDGRNEESKRSSVDSRSARGDAKPTKHNNSKSSKDAAFKNLITTFNKKEPESYKPKVYSNMMQGLVEFQVKMGGKSSKGSSHTKQLPPLLPTEHSL